MACNWSQCYHPFSSRLLSGLYYGVQVFLSSNPSLFFFSPPPGSQYTQTCYSALQTPYIVFGLGRTTNYVDKLSVTVPYTSNKVGSLLYQTILSTDMLDYLLLHHHARLFTCHLLRFVFFF